MIGSKKLSTIRQELEEALAGGGDPIERLDRQIAATKRKGERVKVFG